MTKPDLISPWMPEPNALTHQAIGKLGEEAAELAAIAFRCLIQGLNGSEPVTDKGNARSLQEEMSDVVAALAFVRELTGVDVDQDRVERKLSGYHRWAGMILDIEDPERGASEYTPEIVR